jgi:hypothetical protein
LKKTLPYSKVVGTKGEHSLLPFCISFENLTSDVGLIEKQVHCIDARHYNAYLIVTRLVYHLSTKLMNDVVHICLGKNEEIKVIHFITRFGYATRANPYCRVHRAYGKYTNMHTSAYINNCDDWNRIILATIFLVMLLNACFMNQGYTNTNLLITVSNRFDYRMTLTDDTFMNTLINLFAHIKLYTLWIICLLIIP